MVFKNRIEIYSPGTFPEKITPEEFAEGNKKAIRRNRLITQTLYYSIDMETFATGLKKIRTLCSEAGVDYEFLREEYGFTVIFYRHCGDGWGWSSGQGETQKNIQRDNGTLNGTLNNALSHSEEQKKQLKDLIMNNPKITRRQMAEELNISARSVQRLLNDMPEVHFTGGGRSGHWVIDNN